MAGAGDLHRPQQIVQLGPDFQNVDDEDEQFVVPASTHAGQQHPHQQIDLGGGGQEVAALAVVERHGEDDLMFAQEAL